MTDKNKTNGFEQSFLQYAEKTRGVISKMEAERHTLETGRNAKAANPEAEKHLSFLVEQIPAMRNNLDHLEKQWTEFQEREGQLQHA